MRIRITMADSNVAFTAGISTAIFAAVRVSMSVLSAAVVAELVLKIGSSTAQGLRADMTQGCRGWS